MDPMHGNLWGTVILLSLWSGTAEELKVCLENKQTSSGTCKVELTCSSLGHSGVKWFRGNKEVTDDQRHQLRFGGIMLVVTLDSQFPEPVYTCKGAGTGVGQTVDLGETCGYSNIIKSLPDISSVKYQRVKIILTAIFLASYAAALLITFYLCRQQSSNNEKKREHKQGEEIYSDLLSLETQPDTNKQAQTTGQSGQGKPKEPSQLTVEAEVGPDTGLRMQAMAGPSTGSIREQSKAAPAASLRRQVEAGSKSGSTREQAEAGPAASLQQQDEAEPITPQVQQPTYTGLKKRPKDAEYQILRRQESDGESAVTYSAEAEEVTLQATA